MASAVKRELTEQHIALLWERMTMIYGHRWTSSYGEKDDGSWITGLSDISVEQVKRGLEECRVSKDEWPPSMPVFRSRCLVKQYTAPYHEKFQKLQKPQINPEIAERELARMKAILRPKIVDQEAIEERQAIQQESGQ